LIIAHYPHQMARGIEQRQHFNGKPLIKQTAMRAGLPIKY
jgi:hypothetical protein